MLSIAHILALLTKYKYLILFPTLIIEGPVATILAAFLASPAGGNILHIVPVFLLVLVADIAGDTIYYLIGRHCKDFFVSRYPKRVSVDPARMNRIERYFKAHGVKTLMLGKVSHGLGWPVMIAAGSARMPYPCFILISIAVSVVKSFALVAAGYYYGLHYETLVQYFGKAGILFTAIAVSMIAFLAFKKYDASPALKR